MSKKILIIEDEQTINKAIHAMLKEADHYIIKSATDGEEGLRLVNEFKPDLVLLDLILPKLDGFSVLHNIKQNPKTKNTPVIVMTNMSDVNDKVRQLGAKECLIKSEYSIDDIKSIIKKHLV